MTPHRCPKSLDELHTLPVTVKPAWRSWWLRIFGPIILLGDWLGVRVATRFLDDYWTTAGGWNHAPRGFDGEVPRGLELHESVHDWQKRTCRAHDVRYVVSLDYRRHAEAQAYALEVVLGLRDLMAAARSMADPIYAMALTESAAQGWILAYMSRWRRDCEDV